jgi:ketosteroid isomerase-like protein
MRRRHSILAVTVLAALAAATAGAGDEAAGLKARAKSWEKAFNASQLEEVAAMYASDGMRMPPNAAAVKGRDAVLAQPGLAQDDVGRGDRAGTVIVEGGLGVAYGTYKIKSADGAVVDNGKWVSVAKKVNGSWTTVSDIWNSDRPLPAR